MGQHKGKWISCRSVEHAACDADDDNGRWTSTKADASNRMKYRVVDMEPVCAGVLSGLASPLLMPPALAIQPEAIRRV